MKTKTPVSLQTFRDAGKDRGNRMLPEWLSDDSQRAQLFACINKLPLTELEFFSRDATPRECDCVGVDARRKRARADHVPVTVVTSPAEVKAILVNQKEGYSSRVYA